MKSLKSLFLAIVALALAPVARAAAPAAPTGLTATRNDTEGIRLTWEAVDGASYYVVYRYGGKTSQTGLVTETVTMDAGKTLTVSGGNISVDNESVLVKAEGIVDLDGDSLNHRGDQVVGHGAFKWNVVGRSNTLAKNDCTPFVFRRLTVTVPANTRTGTLYLKNAIPEVGEYVENYSWSVVGHQIEKQGMSDSDWEKTRLCVLACGGSSASNPVLTVHCEGATTSARTFTIDVMGVVRAWTDDTRGTK